MAWVRHLDSSHVDPGEVTKATTGHMVAFRDPDNIALEFSTLSGTDGEAEQRRGPSCRRPRRHPSIVIRRRGDFDMSSRVINAIRYSLDP